jgi:hypothetical protein
MLSLSRQLSEVQFLCWVRSRKNAKPRRHEDAQRGLDPQPNPKNQMDAGYRGGLFFEFIALRATSRGPEIKSDGRSPLASGNALSPG